MALALLCVLSSPAVAATYYVRTDGNNSNSGTGSGAGQAWATVGHAFTGGLAAGDTVYIAPGTYIEEIIVSNVDGANGNPIRFIGDRDGAVFGSPGEAILKGTSADEALTLTSCDYLEFQTLSFTADSSKPAIDMGNCLGCVFKKCDFYDAEHAVTTGDYAFTMTNCLVRNCSGNGIETGSGNKSYIINCTIVGCGDDGLALGGGSSTIRNCIFANNGSFGVDKGAGSVTYGYNLFYNNVGGSYDGLSLDSNDIVADPQFNGGSDYRLQATSPAIDEGVDYSSLVTGDFYGLSRPQGSAWDIGFHEYEVVTPNGKTILMVVNASTLSSEESSRQSQFESWGYTVTTIVDSDSQANFDAALATADVVYFSEEVGTTDAADKLRYATIGIVCEDSTYDDNLGFSTANGYESSGTAIYNVDTSHPITSGLSGTTTICGSTAPLTVLNATLAVDAEVLATTSGGGAMLVALEKGATLANTVLSNSTAVGRRVRMPVGGSAFAWSSLNTTGLTLVKQAIEWASRDGLVGHWKLDETSGTTATDSSEFGHDGTYTNGASPGATGIKGYAADFDGSNDHVTISGGDDYNLRRSLTVACWAKSDTATWSGWGCLVSKRNQFYIHPNSGDTSLYFAINQDGGGDTTATFDMADLGGIQQWRHYAGVYDYNAGEVRLYVDGVLRATGTITADTKLVSDTGEMTIGWDDGMTGTRYFDGLIDDVRLYSRALTADEIAELYGPRHHWKFNEGSGTTVADTGPGALNASFNDGTPAWTNGLRRYALDFDGLSDVETDENFDPPETGSVAFWFRQAATPTGTQRFIGCSNLWEIRTASTGGIHCDLSGPPGTTFSSALGVVTVGQWRHLIASYDTIADRYELYLDGELHASGSYTCDDEEAAKLTFGSRTGSATWFNGAIDDVVIYDRMLTAKDVAELYGLLGHWKLNETSGALAADSSGVGNDGSYQAAPTLGQTGVRGYAMEKTLGTQYVEVASTGALGDLAVDHADFSVAMWVKPGAVTIDGRAMLHKGTLSGLERAPLVGLLANTNQIHYRVTTTNHFNEGGNSVAELTADEWSQVVVVKSGTSYSCYINGELDSSATLTGTTTGTAGDLFIGSGVYSTGDDYPLAVDDVMVYDRVMTPQEITEHYGLVGYWKMDESSGSVAYDSSGMGNDAAWTGTAAWGSGKIDGAAELDGTNYLSVSKLVTETESVSLAGWVKLTSMDSSGSEIISISDYVGLRARQEGDTTAYIYNGSSWENTTGGPSLLGTGWRHVVMTYDDTDNTIKLYIDGSLQSSSVLTGPISYSGIGSITYMGVDGFDALDADVIGSMDDLRIYNRAILSDEVQELYDAGGGIGLRIIKWVETR